MIVLLLLACSGSAEPVAQAPVDCADEPHEELRIPCWISRAEVAAEASDPVGADAACAQVPEGRWAEECAFRVGEELARAGRVVEGVAFCARAERYARFCLTHVAWRLTPDPTWDPKDPTLPGTLDALVTAAAAGLDGLPTDRRDAGLRDLRAGLWHRLYYGHGRPDPAAARAAAGEDGFAARTAWALEAVRILAPWDQALPGDLRDRVVAAWGGDVPSGEPLPRARRVGRYVPAVPPRELGQVRAWPTFGGGVRLVSQDLDTDLRIALVEALFFRETTTADDLAPFLDDLAPEVRWTAAWRMVGLLRPAPGDPAPFADHTDPVVRALARPPEGRGTPERP